MLAPWSAVLQAAGVGVGVRSSAGLPLEDHRRVGADSHPSPGSLLHSQQPPPHLLCEHNLPLGAPTVAANSTVQTIDIDIDPPSGVSHA